MNIPGESCAKGYCYFALKELDGGVGIRSETCDIQYGAKRCYNLPYVPPTPHHFTIPQRKLLPFPATRSLTISPSSLVTTNDRYVLRRRNSPWLNRRPDSLLFQRGIIILRRLRNWCMNAMLRPGLVLGGGTDVIWPSPSRAALGGFRNNLRCASNVIGFVGCILTSAVDDR